MATMNFLLCIDGSENADRAARYLGRLASWSDVKVTLTHIIDEREARKHLGDQEDRELAERRIQGAVEALDKAGVDYEKLIQIGDPAEVILEMGPNYDGIVMGYVGHGMLSTVIMGSVSEKVLNETKRPVTLVP
ncbi:MAG: universal stress protein [Methanomassiliicoccales archaeon]